MPTASHEVLRTRVYDLYGGVLCFSEWCGLRYDQSRPEDARMHLPWADRIAGPDGAIGPGMMTTLADAASGQVAAAIFDWRAQIATISLGLNLIRPAPPGAGLVAEAARIWSDDRTVLTEVRIHADGPGGAALVAAARLRMIVVAQCAPPETPGRYPVETPAPGRPFWCGAGADTGGVAEDGRLVLRIPPAPQFLGNRMRGALHGGYVAGCLFEGLARLGRATGAGFRPLDGVVDFLRSAAEADMVLTAELPRAGARIGFATARLDQTPPGRPPALTARLSATLMR